ncbi:hypothetical protein D910_08526 [Dendroctonus ponderosae]|uniref:Lipase n=1 Tax=Dendroctonus ponderosae TaxID=77166 RepID=U4UDQ3_DENPD|nr:hypothetical protein D910_08526 [Dendroctonus ponderosae]
MSSLRVVVIFVLFCANVFSEAIWLDPDTGLNLYEFIDRHGYSYENHTITTDDGYILTTVRIPQGKNESSDSNTTKPVALLLHGIWSNPKDLIIKGDESIGFLLAEKGYDVFLMASRGNTYSLGHTNLSSDSVAYWNFSWHEVGYYDIPANMDYIQNLTGLTNVSYVGHSQGGTAFVVLAATRPEYRTRVTVANLLAPVVYMDHCQLPFFNVLKEYEEELVYLCGVELIELRFCFHDDFTDLGLNKGILTSNPIYLQLAVLFCSRDSAAIDSCVEFFGDLAGPDPNQLNTSMITVMSSTDPAGGAFKQVIHYLQVARTSEFRKYDYRDNNELAYNQSEPPYYDLADIDDVPIYIWYGANDYFSGALDFTRLISENPSATAMLVEDSLWNHIDFVFGIDAKSYVYDKAISLFNTYNGL